MGRKSRKKLFASEEELLSAIEKNLNVGAEGFETAAVITMTEEEAFDISRLLQNRGIEVSYVDRDSSAFRKGLTVTTFYLAKGLEFDQVFAGARTGGEPSVSAGGIYLCHKSPARAVCISVRKRFRLLKQRRSLDKVLYGNNIVCINCLLLEILVIKRIREAFMESIWSKTCEIPKRFTSGQ